MCLAPLPPARVALREPRVLRAPLSRVSQLASAAALVALAPDGSGSAPALQPAEG
jgi:hypothetical protein